MKKRILSIILTITCILPSVLSLNLEAHADDSVARLYGVNRYETNKVIIEKLYNEDRFTNTKSVIMVSGEVFPDTLSASNLSRVAKSPLILTAKNDINEYTKETLDMLEVENIMLVGGSNSVSEEVFNELSKNYDIHRLAGTDRYETSEMVMQVAENFVPSAGTITVHGSTYQNALSVTKFAEENNYNVLLTPFLDDYNVGVFPKNDDYYAVSGKSFEEINKKFLDMTETDKVAIASVNSFPDAISAVNLAASGDHKILLTDSLSDDLLKAYPDNLVVGGSGTLDFKEDYSSILGELNGKQMTFSSGVGGWSTVIEFTDNGKFIGMYYDGDYSESYQSFFYGKFSVVDKIDDLTYQLSLDTIEVISPTGYYYKIRDNNNNIKPVYYVDSTYGFENSKNFYLYLRGSQVKDLPDEFVDWIYGLRNYRSLDNYALYNADQGYGMKSYGGSNEFYNKEVNRFYNEHYEY